MKLPINTELLRYLFAGIGSNIINFVVYLLLYPFGVPLFLASVAGYLSGFAVSYHFGRVWVFGQQFDISRQNVTRFVAVYAVGGFGMSALIELLDKTTGIDCRISWFFGAIFAVINNFCGLKWFVFNGNDARNGN